MNIEWDTQKKINNNKDVDRYLILTIDTGNQLRYVRGKYEENLLIFQSLFVTGFCNKTVKPVCHYP